MPSFGYPPRGNKGVATKASKVRGVRTEVTLPAPAENFQSRCLLHVICMRHAARFSFPPAREARDYAITRRDSVSASRRRRSRHASVMRDSQSGLFLRLFRFITSVSTERRLAGPTAFFLLCSSLRGLLFLRRHWRLSSPFAALAVRIPSAFLNADQVPWHAIPRPGSGRVSLSLSLAHRWMRAGSFPASDSSLLSVHPSQRGGAKDDVSSPRRCLIVVSLLSS
jgi:hypothetical protein